LNYHNKDTQVFPGFSEFMPPEDSSWEFTNADTQYLTHGLFPYPARMIPQIAARLISLYWPTKSQIPGPIMDVFCGSGTVLVEASLRGIPSIGTDINPFAVMLSLAKTTCFDQSAYILAKQQLQRQIQSFTGEEVKEMVPTFDNLYHWFKPNVVAQLSYLRCLIDKINDKDVQRIFKTIFAHAVMKCSNVNWKSSRYIRVFSEAKIANHNPDAFLVFQGMMGAFERKLTAYCKKKKTDTLAKQEDARSLTIPNNHINLIITSPPYGEERNTVPYIRWSKLFLLWLGFSQKDIKQLETITLGGDSTRLLSTADIPSDTFWQTVSGVTHQRLNEAIAFMIDYMHSLREMYRILQSSGKACIVIGHRSISRKLLDMGKVTKELAETLGFIHETTYLRCIPKKMIPWTGPTGETIAQESIVILSKES